MAQAVLRAIARSPRLAKVFLVAMGALLRASPDFPLKANVQRSLAQHPWPESLRFPPRRVELCDGLAVDLVPQVGRISFGALVSHRLDYESDVFQALAGRMAGYDAIVEIGANVGVFSVFLVARRRGADVPVFCFEPSAAVFGQLRENLAIAGAANVFPVPAAVSETCGLVPFFEPLGHSTNGSLLPGFASLFSDRVAQRLVPSVDGAAISALLAPWRRILLKIDVEGAEARVLAQLMPLVRDKAPDILVEVLDADVDGLNALPGLASAYRLQLITPGGLRPMERFEAHPEHRDYLLLPRG